MDELLIRTTQKSDLQAIVTLEKHKENTPYILPNTLEEHQELLEQKDAAHLILYTSKTDLIGFVLLTGIANKNNSIEFRRIVIHQKGKGYGRSAIKAIKQHCFEKLNANRLWLDVLENNARARYLYHSEGFKEEGKLRASVLIEQEYHNLIIMSILKSEYAFEK